MKNRVRDVLLRRSALIVTLIMILGAVALIRLVLTHQDVEDVANIDFPLIEILTRIETNQLEQSINLERAMRFGQQVNSDITWQDFINADSTFRYLARLVDEDLVEADQQLTIALSLTDQPAQQSELGLLLQYIRKLELDHTDYEKDALAVLGLLERSRIDSAQSLMRQVADKEDRFNKQVERTLMRHELFTETMIKMVEKEELLSMRWIVILTLSFVMISVVAVYTFSYRIWRPLEDIRTGAEKLGAGDFDTKIKLRSNSITEDIVDAFNNMADELKVAQKDVDSFVNFSYRTAHDLKAPIINLKSLLDMLDKDKVNTAHYETVLKNAKRTATKLEASVDALTEFNQIRERLGARKERLSVDEIFNEVEAHLAERIKLSNAVIKKDFSKCPYLDYPKAHLRSVLQHLLSNAIKYRDPEKRLMIEIKSAEPDDHPTIMIRDNGLGFDAIKHADDVLKPFVKVHAHAEGPGLGMYIVKTILDYHKGSIRMDSQPKKGALFIVKLYS